MARTLEDFVGTFTIRYGQGMFGIVQADYLLCIGTGEYGDPKPDGIRVGVSIFDPQTERRVLPTEENPPIFAYLVDGSLNGSSYWLEDERLPQVLVFQISLMTLRSPKGLYRAPSIMIAIGDPDNAGTWGADDDSSGFKVGADGRNGAAS